MKIDLVGPRQRGLAMGLNEAAGYVAVSLSALATGYLASTYDLRPAPFYPGFAFALLGFLLSAFFVHETRPHAEHEANLKSQILADPQSEAKGTNSKSQSPILQSPIANPQSPSFAQILLLTSWKDRALFAAAERPVGPVEAQVQGYIGRDDRR